MSSSLCPASPGHSPEAPSAAPWEMKNPLWPLLARGLMAKGCFPITTQSEQLLEDYKALDFLLLILNVISAGQFLQMSPSPSPASLSPPLPPNALPQWAWARTRACEGTGRRESCPRPGPIVRAAHAHQERGRRELRLGRVEEGESAATASFSSTLNSLAVPGSS